MNGSRVVGFLVVLAGLALAIFFVNVPRESFTTTERGSSCEGCLDIIDITTTETRIGFPLVWKMRIERNGSFQEDEFRRIDKAVVDFVAGAGIVLVPAAVIIGMRRKK